MDFFSVTTGQNLKHSFCGYISGWYMSYKQFDTCGAAKKETRVFPAGETPHPEKKSRVSPRPPKIRDGSERGARLTLA